MKHFNPRIKDIVYFISGYGNCPWLVLGRKRNYVLLRRVGMSASLPVNTHISNLCLSDHLHTPYTR